MRIQLMLTLLYSTVETADVFTSGKALQFQRSRSPDPRSCSSVPQPYGRYLSISTVAPAGRFSHLPRMLSSATCTVHLELVGYHLYERRALTLNMTFITSAKTPDEVSLWPKSSRITFSCPTSYQNHSSSSLVG